MTRPLTLALATLLLLTPTTAFADKEDFFGYFTLEGKYSNNRKTEVLIQFRSDRVTRSAEYTSGRWKGRDVGTWTAMRSDMRWYQSDRLLKVIYRLEPPRKRTQTGLLIEGLNLATADRDDVIAALDVVDEVPARELRALYWITGNGDMRELIRNPQVGAAWRWIECTGPRLGGGGGTPTVSPFTTAAQAVIAADWAEFTDNRYYEHTMTREDSENLTQADFDEIDAEEVVWTVLSKAWVSFDGDEVRSDSISDRYAAGDPYKDAAGATIPEDQLEIWNVRLKFELGGWEHYATKTYVFNKADGALVDQDEEFEEESPF